MNATVQLSFVDANCTSLRLPIAKSPYGCVLRHVERVVRQVKFEQHRLFAVRTSMYREYTMSAYRWHEETARAQRQRTENRQCDKAYESNTKIIGSNERERKPVRIAIGRVESQPAILALRAVCASV
jgi:hypothetical protein